MRLVFIIAALAVTMASLSCASQSPIKTQAITQPASAPSEIDQLTAEFDRDGKRLHMLLGGFADWKPTSAKSKANESLKPMVWPLFVEAFNDTERHFKECGDWGNPTTFEQDEQVQARMLESLERFGMTVQSGQLSHTQWELVQMEVREIDVLGGRRSRNFHKLGDTSMGETHYDFLVCPEGPGEYAQLLERLPLLKQLHKGKHNPAVTAWIAARVRMRAEVLKDPEAARWADRWLFSEAQRDKHIPAKKVRTQALDLVRQ